ncbi:hypothetical protein [Breznakiella homolactica]|uniref:DUF2238 domain-containing protein n=1 Tax=Breznakiella homolactica TaxID=2798577 RepID=A0A7T7XR33_9SPIR|nr:hypothetical protein [Breznakiella homolactica]QQO10949.1 hypothetical protein JFL75_08535 [Breznakiella homolactica]
MEAGQKKLRIVNGLYLLTGVFITVYQLLRGNVLSAVLGPVSWFFLLIPPLAKKLLRIKLPFSLHTFVMVFCFLGFGLGTALDWYERVPFFNAFVHFLSGYLFTMFGYCFYFRIKREKPSGLKDEWFVQLVFAFCFSMAIAVFWEIGEFAAFFITGHDSQHTLTTGVFDTMYDIISCVFGSLTAALAHIWYVKKNTNTFVKRTVEQFYTLNRGEA